MLTDGDVSEHFSLNENEKQALPNPPCEGGKLMGTKTKTGTKTKIKITIRKKERGEKREKEELCKSVFP